MIIPVNDLVNYRGDDWQSFLEEMCLYEPFRELVEEYRGDAVKLTGIIRFIVWAYSVDSNKIVLRKNWITTKIDIFNLTGLQKEMEPETVYLKNRTVLATAKKYLEMQNDENFQNWIMLNDLIAELRLAANGVVKKNTGEIDYKVKVECAQNVIELLVKKAEVEQKFIQNNEKLKDAYKEVSQMSAKQASNSFGLETQLKEHKNVVN